MFSFGENEKVAFEALKKDLVSAPVLKLYDPLAEIRVLMDASGSAAGAGLE